MKNLILTLIALFCFSSIHAQWYNETIDFETTSSMVWIDDTQENNIWQIGIPQKDYFDQAYSATHAILTDTILSYGENVHSSFVVSVEGWTWFDGSPSILSFEHKFDTDTLTDGGYIDVSYDGGENWLRIIHDSTMFNCNWTYGWGYYADNFYGDHDTLFNGEPGFSGRSDGWETATFEWLYCIGVKDTYPDSLMIRFNFISDNGVSDKEGWMIDNIKLMSFECSGVDKLENAITASVSPNPVNEWSVLSVEGLDGRDYDLEIFDINGRNIFAQQKLKDPFVLNVIAFEPGLYFYKITLDQGFSYTGKFLK